jgi:CHAD domain-containing protein
MKTTVEQELKFEGDDIPIERLGREPIEPHVFASSYHDTADRRLLRAGITLRRRVENGVGRWQLKLPSDASRLELEEPGGSVSPLPTLARLLSGILRGSELELVATPETHRHGCLVEGVEVTVDDVSVLEGMAVVQHFSEVEAELVGGSRVSIEHVGKALRGLGATPGTATPKILRVVELPKAPSVSPEAPALDHLCAFISAQLDELRKGDPIVRATDDADAVHDMRVAVRRLRTILRTARPMLSRAWVDDLRSELDRFGRLFGSVRDLDVLIEHLTREATEAGAGTGETEGLLAPLEAERDRARVELRAAIEDERYYVLLDRLEAATASLPVTRTDLTVEQFAKKEFKKLRLFGKRASRDDDRQLHKLRIHGKRARYAAELAQRSRGAPATRFVKASTRLQDVLGEHQDAAVAIDRLQLLARIAESRGAAFTAGRLTEREEQRKLQARRDLHQVWKRVEKRGKAAW